MPKRAGKESLTLSQESLAKAVHNMCWSGCWSYFAFSLLTVFIIRLEIRAVIREYVSTRIKRYIINIVWRIVLYNKYNKSVHQYKKITMQINQVMSLFFVFFLFFRENNTQSLAADSWKKQRSVAEAITIIFPCFICHRDVRVSINTNIKQNDLKK